MLFFFQAEDGIRDTSVTGVQTCALPIWATRPGLPMQLSAHRQTGKGKGDAVRLGFERATGDLLMILDADLTVPPEDLPSFFEVAARGQADVQQGTGLVHPTEARAKRRFNQIGNGACAPL